PDEPAPRDALPNPAAPGGAAPDHRTVIHRAPGVERWERPTAVVDRSQLEDAAADLPEVLDHQPGLDVTRLGGLLSFSLLSIRGSTADQVLVFVDGIPLNVAEGGPVDLSALPLGPIGSVAVYRGLSPLVLGSSAIGGALDIRTRRLRGDRLEVEAGGGSFGTRTARAFYGHGEGRFGAGIAVDYQGTAGDFTYTSDGGTAWTTEDDGERTRKNNATDQVGVMAKLRATLDEGLHVTTMMLVVHRWGGLAGLGLWDTEESRLASTRNLAGVRLEALDGPVQVAATAYASVSMTQLDDPLGEIGLAADETRSLSLVPGLTVALRAPLSEDDAPWRVTPVAVASWRYEHWTQVRADTGEGGDGPSAGRHVLTAAAGASLFGDPLDSALSLAARFEGGWSETDDGTSRDVTGWSLRAAFLQRSLPNTRIQLAATRSLRLPSLYELYGDTGYVLGNAGLRPERGLGVELGVQHDAAWFEDGLLTFEGAVFANFVDDLIQMVQNSQGVARPENIDAGRIAGVEAGLSLDGWRHLRLRGALTWLDAVDTSDLAAREGKRLPFRPEIAAHARLEVYHDFGGAAVGEVALRVELDHASGSYLDHANLVAVPSRLVLGLGAEARLWRDQLRFDLAVRNVANDRVQDLSGYPLPGLSVMATLGWTPDLEGDR
ncbi:MAG: TonB-dependent receptor, partial [Deltaproteobacteria bacterium]